MWKKVVSFSGLVFSDFAAILLSFLLAFLIRRDLLPEIFPYLRSRPVFFEIYLNHSYVFFIWFSVFFYDKLYFKRYAYWEEARLLLKSTTLAFSVVMIAVFVTHQYFPFSRMIILLAWVISPLALLLTRYTAKRVIIGLGLWRKKVIVIASGQRASLLIESIQRNRTMGYDLTGCLTDDPEEVGKVYSGVPVRGLYKDCDRWQQELGFEDIIVSLPDMAREEIVGHLRHWDQLCETIRYVPRTGDLITTGVEIENIGKILSLTLRKNLHKPWNVMAKTVFEFCLVVLLLLVFSPVFLVIAMAIKLDSSGPVFFLQDRYGKRGRRIRVIKFRSMFQDADKRLEIHLEQDPQAKREWEEYKKLKKSDPRVTRVGRVLRRHSLDELPQFFNVLKGEMSLVGPRPYLMEELRKVEALKSILLQVRPGITGLWQTSGRSRLSFAERLNTDEYYLRNWSFWMDAVILIRTVEVFLSGEGAY
jgi:undecaprenyl-phosphate galactose phosphotransferase